MLSRNNNFLFGANFNFATTNLLVAGEYLMGNAPPPNPSPLLLTTLDDFYLTDGTDLFLAGG